MTTKQENQLNLRIEVLERTVIQLAEENLFLKKQLEETSRVSKLKNVARLFMPKRLWGGQSER